MSKSLVLYIAAFIAIFATEGAAMAAKYMHAPQMESSYGSSQEYRQEMLMDFSIHYVRGTKPEDATDTAGRFSLGGMFNQWFGLDAQTLYEIRSRSYLVGGDIRFAPTEWCFLKGGLGGYADKQTRALTLTPLVGAGIMARVTHDYYFVTEASYFQINKRDQLSFGAGVGLSF